MKGISDVNEYGVLIGFCLIFIWGWRRVYLHVMRKSPRPLIAHMLGLLLSLFPARFFVYAAFAVAPPTGVEPVSDTKTLLLCILFFVSVMALHILTRKKVPKAGHLQQSAEQKQADEENPH